MACRWLYRARLLARSLFLRSAVERELEEEMRFHVAREVAAGGGLESTRGIEQRKEECRDMRGLNWLEEARRDIRYGARTLARTPGFTAACLLALALGIGANTAMYSVVHAVLLRPLDVREPDRLVRVYESNPSRNAAAFSASMSNYLSWKERSRCLDVAIFQGYTASWTQDGGAERLEGMAASASFLPVLGGRMQLGRWFQGEEEKAGQHRVAVLSERLWATRFGRDPGIAGRKLLLNGEPYEIVGVASEGVGLPDQPDLFVPLTVDPGASRGNRQYTVIGRIRPGFSTEQARAEMVSIAAGLERQFPESNKGWSVSLVPLMRWLVPAEIRTALLVLLAAVGTVLLIACANVANLLVARGETRRKELAIRAAMGAGASRLTRQVLTESLMLALLGGALGVGLGSVIVDAAKRSLHEIVPRADEIAIDPSVLAFACGMSILTGLLFGLTPILQLGKMRKLEGLREAGRSSQPGLGNRMRGGLVIAQVSLATLLLTGAGLLLQSFARLQGVALGFDSAAVLTARVSLPRLRYADGQSIASMLSHLTEGLQAAPGVQAAGVSNGIPLGPGSSLSGTGVADPAVGPPVTLGWRSADAGYFAALRIPLLRGRVFGPEDGTGRRVAVLTQQAAISLYGAGDPVGCQLRLNGEPTEVIGVVGDVRMKSVADPAERLVYVPVSQGGRFAVYAIFVKMRSGAAEAGASLIRERLREIDSGLPIYGVRAMNDWVETNSARARIRTWALALLAGVAVALGMIGIYGVLAYLVTLRRHEFGVRLALGARPGSLLRLVLGQGIGLAVIGIGIGLAAAALLTRLLETLLFDTQARDPWTFVAVAALLLAATAIACYGPARRAARVDPMIALRGD